MRPDSALTPTGEGTVAWPRITCPDDVNQRACLMKAIDAANRLSCTHIAICDPLAGCVAEALSRIVSASRRHPSALVVGHRSSSSKARSLMGRVGGWLKRFLVRLQTGVSIGDPDSTLRIYPTVVLQHLAPKAKGANALRALLVKSAWAGVAVEEVAIEIGVTEPDRPDTGWTASVVGALITTLLNIHWTLRAMIPWPHQRINRGDGKDRAQVSILRPIQSIRLLLAENATPGQLAWAGAMGVFIGALPIFGFHMVTILLTANYFRLNKMAAVTAGTLCTPPFVPAFCIELGYYLRHGRFLTEASIQTLGYQAVERVYEWFLGSLILGPLLAMVVGGLIYLIAAPMFRKIALMSDEGTGIAKLSKDLPVAGRND